VTRLNAPRANKASQNLDDLLSSRAAGRIIESLGLDLPLGSSLASLDPPTAEADAIAVAIVNAAVPRLASIYAETAMRSFRGADGATDWLIELPPLRDNLLINFGLPILGAFSSAAAYELSRLLPASRTPVLNPESRQIRRLLTEFLFAENEQWRMWVGMPMPYAFRFRAISWLWSPEAHETQRGREPQELRERSYCLCLMCGDNLPRRRKPRSGVPLCEYCIKVWKQPWPSNAIAPIARGQWHLHCEHPGCSSAIAGPGQRKKCDAHQASRLTPSKRAEKQ
jgi:hypothetical protein